MTLWHMLRGLELRFRNFERILKMSSESFPSGSDVHRDTLAGSLVSGWHLCPLSADPTQSRKPVRITLDLTAKGK